MRVIPFGYSSPNAERALDELMVRDERAILVDIRYSTVSRKKPEWSHDALQAKYGNRYLWIRELGNVNYFEHNKGIKIANPDKGLARLITGLERGYTPILLCTCPRYETCHRKVVIDLLRERMPSVEVVQPNGKQGCFIKCLSIKQPYAHWITHPEMFINAGIQPKKIENRDWNTSERGTIFIHAGKNFDADGFGYWLNYRSKLEEVVPTHPDQYVRGAIVGMAKLVDVVQDSEDFWFLGDYGFVLEDAQEIEPFPYRGQLKFFDVEVCHCCSMPVNEDNSEVIGEGSKTYRLCWKCNR